MAGGIDWFRWHHGSVTDQKFGLIGRKAGASVAEVIAVWACLLEAASSAEERGILGPIDFEAMDFALGMDDAKVERIYVAMVARDLIDQHGHIVSWPKRQPKREREDDTAAERKRRQRGKEAEQNGAMDGVTPSHAESRQKTPRGEERREDKTSSNPNGLVVASDAADLPAKPCKPDCPHQEIIALYHEVLPMCPQIRDWTPARATQLRARWNEDEKRQNLDYWKQFFEYVGQCDFLVGRAGKTPFFADLEWMTKSANFTKIREAKYENKRST